MKNLILTGCLLPWFLVSCASVTKKEDIISQAKEIKAATPPEPVETASAEPEVLPQKEETNPYAGEQYNLDESKLVVFSE